MSGKRLISLLSPSKLGQQVKNFATLARDFGQFTSIRSGQAEMRDGVIVPWYTYPAIEYLNSLDFAGKRVFEYGSGNSSRYWARKVAQVVSVEDHRDWHARVSSNLADNQTLLLREESQAYAEAILEDAGCYDIVVIDGNHRPACARAALDRVADGGLIVLDNSDWYHKVAAWLREHGDFIQVDFYGFGPINHYTWTTSLFISRKAQLKPASGRQPDFAIGGLRHDLAADEDY